MSNKVSSYPATCYIQLGVKSSLCAYSITSCEECFIVKDETSTYESPFKVPTCILTEISTDGGHTLLDFGFLALRNYHQCRPDTKNKICLFQDFVIPTETEMNGEGITTLDKTGTEEIDTLSLIIMALKYFKQRLFTSLNKSGLVVSPHKALWIVTVPDCWSNFFEANLNKSAHQAGLIPKENYGNILLVLESEAVSMLFKDSPDTTRNTKSCSKAGIVYMVINIQENIGEVVINQVWREGDDVDHCLAKRGPWKIKTFHGEVMTCLRKTFGTEFVDEIEMKYPGLLKSRADKVYRTYSVTDCGTRLFTINPEMQLMYRELSQMDLCYRGPNIYIDEDCNCCLTSEKIKAIFHAILVDIHYLIFRVSSEFNININHLLFFQNNGHSKCLVEKVRKLIPRKIIKTSDNNLLVTGAHYLVSANKDIDHLAAVLQFHRRADQSLKFNRPNHSLTTKNIFASRGAINVPELILKGLMESAEENAQLKSSVQKLTEENKQLSEALKRENQEMRPLEERHDIERKSSEDEGLNLGSTFDKFSLDRLFEEYIEEG